MTTGRKRKLVFGERQTREETYDADNDSLQVEERLSQLTPTLSSDSSITRQLSAENSSPAKRARLAAKEYLDRVIAVFQEGLTELLSDISINQLQNKKGFASTMLFFVGEIYRRELSMDQIIHSTSPKKYNKNKNWLGKNIIEHYTIANANGLRPANILLNEFRYEHLRIYERTLRHATRSELLNEKIIAFQDLTIQQNKNNYEELTFDQKVFVEDLMQRMDEKFLERTEYQYTNETAFEFLQTHFREHINNIAVNFSENNAADFILCLTHELGLLFAKNRFNMPAAEERSMEIAKILISKAAELHYSRSQQWMYNYNNPPEASLTCPLSDADTASIHSNSSTDTVQLTDAPVLEELTDDDSTALTSSDGESESETESVDWDRTERDEIYSQPRFGSL